MDSFSSFSQKLNPLAKKFAQSLEQGLGQAKQMAQEKFGNATDVTELPKEYVAMEKRVDAVRISFNNLLKVARIYTTEGYDYPYHLQDSFADFTRSLAIGVKQVALVNAGDRTGLEGVEEPPKTLSHALSRASAHSAEIIGVEEPLGTALSKFSIAHDQIGQARLDMDDDVYKKFIRPLEASLELNIQKAMKARRDVQSARLHLDACKANLRNVKPEKEEAAKADAEKAEDQFITAVQEAMGQMKIVVDSPEPIRNLSDLISVQLNYHKHALELLSGILPDVDELQNHQEEIFEESEAEEAEEVEAETEETEEERT